jgi:hypothetical protein
MRPTCTLNPHNRRWAKERAGSGRANHTPRKTSHGERLGEAGMSPPVSACYADTCFPRATFAAAKSAPITSDSSSSPDARDQLVHLRLSRTCRIFSGRTWKGGPGGTPTAIGIGGINSSASVQVAPVVILAARLGVGRADVPGHRDHSNRQRGQESEDSKAHDCLSMCRGPLARSSAIGRDSANRVVPPRYVVAGMGRFIRTSSWDTLPRSSPKPRRARPLPSASCARDRLGMRPRRTPKLPGLP